QRLSVARPMPEKPELSRKRGEELTRFLASGERLALPTSDRPQLSIIVALYHRPELALGCLRSLACTVPFEVILVDNSVDPVTSALLAHVDNARVIAEGRNLGFPAAVNRAARLARGEDLLLLNHDAEPRPGSIDSALGVLHSSPDIGAVGAKLVLP